MLQAKILCYQSLKVAYTSSDPPWSGVTPGTPVPQTRQLSGCYPFFFLHYLSWRLPWPLAHAGPGGPHCGTSGSSFFFVLAEEGRGAKEVRARQGLIGGPQVVSLQPPSSNYSTRFPAASGFPTTTKFLILYPCRGAARVVPHNYPNLS